MSGSVQQYLRACSLIVADMTGNGIELAGLENKQILRIRFTVDYQTAQTPASFHARVYNLSELTIQTIIGLASENPPTATAIGVTTTAQVIFKAGYIQNVQTLFTGRIFQMRVGKENATDSYLDIFAADGDLAHNWATMNTPFAKGYTAASVWDSAGQSMKPWGVSSSAPPNGLSTKPSPRGKVCFGMTRDVLRSMANSNNFTWNILNGQLQGQPKFAFNPGQAIVVNSRTGMVGVPEQTENGVTVTTLLNPAITWGTRIQINDTDIARLIVQNPGTDTLGPTSAATGSQKTYIPTLNCDGFYVVLYAQHVGDTRGNEWYTKFTCISNNATATKPLALSVPLPPQ
jgi:hypothetical protein